MGDHDKKVLGITKKISALTQCLSEMETTESDLMATLGAGTDLYGHGEEGPLSPEIEHFLFVLANAWLSLIPGYGTVLAETAHGEVHLLRGANTDINMPLALAVASFVAIQFFGLKSLGGFKYLSKFFRFGGIGKGFKQIFTGKVLPGLGSMFFGIIDVFVGLLELLSEFVRVVSFTFRLFGNMTAGEILLLIAMFLIPYVFALPFYGLELLVGFIQALIFGGLTLVFLTMACAHHEE